MGFDASASGRKYRGSLDLKVVETKSDRFPIARLQDLRAYLADAKSGWHSKWSTGLWHSSDRLISGITSKTCSDISELLEYEKQVQ